MRAVGSSLLRTDETFRFTQGLSGRNPIDQKPPLLYT